MISLSEFFQPLLPFNIVYYFLLFIFFDALGTFFVSKILKHTDEYRVTNWLIGFGLFITLWFLLSLFIPYRQEAVIFSLLIITGIVIPSYLKSRQHVKIFKVLWSLKLPILIILPFLPSVFVKASLPPYYGDEMAYHFISPSTLSTLSPIKYLGGLYADFPRTLNLFWELIFSLTKSYSVGRLFHFTILTTSMLFSYQMLAKNFSRLTGFLFVFIFFSLPQEIVLTSTLGYIDVAAYSFLLIGVMASVDFLLNKKEESIYISSIFWAMNLGTKYTGLSAFVSFLVVFSLIILIKREEYLQIVKKALAKIVILAVVFGGFWYLKNLVLYGNPIFPFIFPCFREFAVSCQTGGSFFGDWTMKVSRENIFPILAQLFASNKILQILIFISPVLLFFTSGSKNKLLAFFLLAPALIELLILKNFSGFYARYHQHMQLYLLASLLILLANKLTFRENIAKGIIFALLLSSIFSYIHVVRYFNTLGFTNWNEINYSIGRMNIYDWISWKFPDMKYTLEWCENPPEGQKAALARFDPDLIWFEPSGQMRVFLTNCYYHNPALEDVEVDEIIDKAKKEKMQFYIASPYKCTPDEEVKPKFEYEQDYQFRLRKINNKIICNAEEIRPNLYYFNYEKL